jgi:hypothetical protein
MSVSFNLYKRELIYSLSYVDIRSKANTTRGLNFEHKIKAVHTREI